MPQGSKTEAEFERSQLIQHLSGLARRDKAQAHQEVREALKDKKITMLQARHVFQNARLAPIMVAFKRLSYEEAERVYEVATDEEKKKLRLMLAQKRHLHQKAA
jgi:ABC-type molybdate transport system ATPase subunit